MLSQLLQVVQLLLYILIWCVKENQVTLILAWTDSTNTNIKIRKDKSPPVFWNKLDQSKLVLQTGNWKLQLDG